MKIKQHKKRIKTLSSVLMILTNQFIYAGAFSLYTEGSVVAVGNFAAGVAAEEQMHRLVGIIRLDLS